MATRRIAAVWLFVVIIAFGSSLLSDVDAIPREYRPRYRRQPSVRCPTCPPDCSEKLAGARAEAVEVHTPLQAQYAVPAVVVPYVPPRPTTQPRQSRYSEAEVAYKPAAKSPAQCPCTSSFDPHDYPSGYECCRCGRSLRHDDDYASYQKYEPTQIDQNEAIAAKKDHRRERKASFVDESRSLADYYRNYRPYVNEQSDDAAEASDYRRDQPGYARDYESEEQSSVSRNSHERDRLFVVYRADAIADPSERQLESVIRQAVDVARQQRTADDFSQKSLTTKFANRYRYEHEKYQDVAEKMQFPALKSEIDARGSKLNLLPGPLMKADEAYVTEDGDEALNPGLDQNNWTIVPALSDLELITPQVLEGVEEIDAAVSVVPEAQPKIKIPQLVQKNVDDNEKIQKESIEVFRTDVIDKMKETATEMLEDMRTPTIVTEATKFEMPLTSVTPTTYASMP